MATSTSEGPSPHSKASPPLSVGSVSSGDANLALPPAAKDVADASAPAPQQIPPSTNADGVITSPPKKPGLSSRLTRMFSSKGDLNGDAATAASISDSHGRPSVGRKESSAQPQASRNGSIVKPGMPHRDSTAVKGQPNGSAKSSVTGPERKGDVPDPNKPKHSRFTMMDDGSHEHLLRSEKRQEKLSHIFKNMVMGKKKDGDQAEHQLSLVSSWVDQVKSEKVAGDEKGGPNCASTLVEKYGKCSEVVGRGAFGIVRISHKTDSKDPRKELLYAVKEFRRRPSESPKKYNKRLTSEFCISSALRHPNVIHTLDLMKDAKGDFCEVMEFCAGGDLYSLVLAAGKLEVIEADCLFKQLMRGVEYIHEMGVAHRDLKPENLLLTTHGSLKITDFGNGECFRMAWEKEPHMVAGLCGSAPYIAPEEYVDNEFDPRAVDVWACGVIYMAMRTGRHLWRLARKDEDEFYERYLEGRRDEDGYGPIETLHRARCRNVIYSILDPNPGRRITASQVLKSEWGREIRLCKAGEEGF